ncbi:MAG: pilus assembly protein FilA, partial [Acinetobacter sp.]
VLSGLTLKTGKMDANIQVGASPQGAMIILDTTMIGGLEITNLGILDNSTKLGTGAGTTAANRAAGEIHIDSIKVASANSTDLAVDAKVSVYGKTDTSNGYLQIVAGTKNTTGTDIYVSGVKLGSSAAASIGDIEVQGLKTYYNPTGAFNANMIGTAITVSGH